MKRLLLSLIALVGIMSVSAQTVLWEDTKGVEVSWGSNAVCNMTAAECASFSAGDEIIITVTGCDPSKDEYPQAVLRTVDLETGDWKNLWPGGPDDGYSHLTKDKEYPYLITITLTEQIVDAMKQAGFFVSGVASTCTKVEYKGALKYEEPEEYTEKALSAEIVASLKPEDKVTVVFNLKAVSGKGTNFVGWGMGSVVVNSEGWPKVSGADLNMKQLGENSATFVASSLLAAEGAIEYGFNINLWGQSNEESTVEATFVKWIIEKVVSDNTPISDIQAEGEIVEVNYTSLSGVKSSEPVKGINIKTVVYSDGTKHVSRIVVK